MSDVTTQLAKEANDKAVEIARLRAENASLRGAAQGLGELCDQLMAQRDERLARAEADNAKLRELVKNMYYDLTQMTFPPDWVTDYEADMRELGVEVNDG